jgi:hypothetical protein
MVDRVFLDIRRFAGPPGSAIGVERFERRPRRATLSSLVRQWLDRMRGIEGDGDPDAVRAYLAGDGRG